MIVCKKISFKENLESQFDTNNIQKNIFLYRALIVASSITYIAWGPFTSHVLDLWREPIWWRLVGTIPCWLILFASFKSNLVKKHIDSFVALGNLATINHYIWFVMGKNTWDNESTFIIGLFLMLFASGIFINKHIQLIFYNVVVSLSLLFSYHILAVSPDFSIISHSIFSTWTFFILLHVILFCKKILLKTVDDSYTTIKTLLSQGVGPLLMVKDGQVVYENPAFEEAFGIKAENKRTSDILTKIGLYQTINGKQVKINRNLITIQKGKYSILNIQDVSEQIKDNLKQMEMSKLASIGEMSAGIAHEINNPLLQIQMLLYQAQTDKSKVDESLVAISSTVERIAEVIKSLREYSDNSPKTKKDVSLNTLVDKVIFMTKQKVQTNKVNLKIDVDSRELISTIQENKVGMVLINIINNSCYAIRNKEKKEINISLKKVGSFAEITIQDSGDGIPREIAQRIFDPFFTTKKIDQGSGLGLSESVAIIADHGGSLSLSKNKPPIFKITLPIKEEVS